ncbi:MAG: DMT family transporter [Acidimicrobiales bacterium]
MSSAATAPATRMGTLTACAAVVMWGAGNVVVKQIRMSGTAIAFNRLWFGVVIFSAMYLLRGGRLSWRALRLAAPGGIAFGLDVALFFTSIKHTSVADASVIGALQPALVFVVAGRLFGEKLTLTTVGWTFVALVGVIVSVVASASGAGRTPGGDLLAVAALVAWSCYFVLSKQARRQLGALEYQASLTIIAALVITPIALIGSHDLVVHDAGTFGWIVVMVVVPGGGHLLMNWAHNYAPITLTSMLTLGIPVVATIGALVALGEPVTAAQAAGIAVVIVAIAAVLRRRATAEPAELTPLDTA